LIDPPPMLPDEKDFLERLRAFEADVEEAAQCLYALLAVNHFAGENPLLLRKLNEAPEFWNTATRAFQTSAFIALHRVFAQDAAYSIDRLVGSAQKNLVVFSPARLADRKRRESPSADVWLPDYLKSVYTPKQDDFRRLRRAIARQRRLYEEVYRPIRNKVYAHREVSGPGLVDLFARTHMHDLQRIIGFLQLVAHGLQDLYWNGRILRPRRLPWNMADIVHRLDMDGRRSSSQGLMVDAVRRVLLDVARPVLATTPT